MWCLILHVVQIIIIVVVVVVIIIIIIIIIISGVKPVFNKNRVLSHFQFAERFNVNATYREQFHKSIWRR